MNRTRALCAARLLTACLPLAAADSAVPLRMTRAAPASLPAWHFRTGLPFAQGALDDKNAVRLMRGDTEKWTNVG